MSFAPDELLRLREEVLTVSDKFEGLFAAYSKRSYNDVRAREHAEHGFLRRLTTLVRCIKNVFEILPPDQVDAPTREERSDVNINLQAFIFNVFGCIDNLAWIWACEKKITKGDGSPIPDKFIGLRKTNKLMRKSFSPGFLRYLDGLDEWLDYLANYRHAAAHRIPLYVPPYVITSDKAAAAHRDLETQKSDALNRGAIDDYDRLLVEQRALGVFKPLMMHSFEEVANPVIFHPQLLADFNTIEELGWKMLEELDL